MRDAFGGTFMIQLLIIFIIIYTGFTALALNYAKAFKAKNAVIEYLEEHEISSIKDNDLSAAARQEMDDYFQTKIAGELNYIYPDGCINSDDKTLCIRDMGIKIEQIEPNITQKNKLGVYYRVTTYFGYDISFLNVLRRLNGTDDGQKIIGAWEIIGETRPIAYE